MRTSRDLLRPLAALVVVVVAVGFVSNVAAYRVAVTPHHEHAGTNAVETPRAAHATPTPKASREERERRERSERRERRERNERNERRGRDDDGDADGGGRTPSGDTGDTTVVVTASGAS